MRANNRDCSHGRQFGKCVDCDVAELEEENTRLRALVQKKDEAIGIAMKYMPYKPGSDTAKSDIEVVKAALALTDAQQPAEQPQAQTDPVAMVAGYSDDLNVRILDAARLLPGDYLYTQPRSAVPDYLRQRCIEIMEWRRTGVVKQNGALAALAATLTKHDDHDRMRAAEAETVSEAIALLAACSTPPTCAAVPDGYRLVPIEAPQEVIARLWAIQNSVKPTYLWKELLELCPTPPTGGAN